MSTTDPNRKILTEEMPETPEEFHQRGLMEVGGQIQTAPPQKRLLTEELPQEEEEAPGRLLTEG